MTMSTNFSSKNALLKSLALFTIIAAGTLSVRLQMISIFPPGATATTVTGMNASAEVVGYYNDGARNHGFKYSNGVYTVIDPPDSASSRVNGINDSGVVVGSYTMDGKRFGFQYSGGQYSTVDPTGCTTNVSSEVVAINNSGDIAGTYDNCGFTRRFGFYRSGNVTSIIDIPGSSNLVVTAMSAQGIVVGYYSGLGQDHGFMWNNGQLLAPFNPTGSAENHTLGVNFLGNRVGHYALSNGVTYAGYSQIGNAFTQITYPGSAINTYATAINSNRDIIGYYSDFTRNKTFGFRLRNGNFTIIDSPGTSGSMGSPVAINDSGDIAGNYGRFPLSFGFLLRNLPDSCTYSVNPSDNVLLASGGSGSFQVTAPVGCYWSVSTSSQATWFQVSGNGNGNGVVNYTVSANSGGQRTVGVPFPNNPPSVLFTLTQLSPTAYRSPFDFDADRKTDLSIFRPSVGQWWLNRSSNGSDSAFAFGTATDTVVPVDYTGDGKTDVAFWRPSTGQWFVLRSEDFSFYAFPFGANGDVPVPADFDGDGKADPAVFRESSSTWFINKSSGGTDIFGFGSAGDKTAVADYDGDGKADVAIFRPVGVNGAEWWVRRSSTSAVVALQFGSSTDKAVPGDFTGDGKADIAFWRPSTGFWNVLRSEDLSYFAFPFGTTGDVPVAGDYDGDGKTDAGVFRPSNSTWFIQRSTAGTLIQQFGAAGDVPLPSAFVR